MKIVTRALQSLLILLLLAGLTQITSGNFTKSAENQTILTEKGISSQHADVVAAPGLPRAHEASLLLASVSTDEEGSDRGMVGGINWLLLIIGVLLVAVIVILIDILGTVGEIQGKPVINWNGFNAKLLLGFGVIGMALAIWEFIEHGKLTVHAQDPASEHGAIYESMFMITLILTGVVFVITQILLFWYGYKYKHSEKRKGLYYPDNHKLEFIWTIVPAVVLTVLVIRGLQTWNNIMNHKDEKATVIEVFGYQFAWNVRYSGADNKLGSHDFRQMDVINALGVDTNDTKAHDDVITSELHLPVGKPVVMNFRAKDVIHSAYLPHFRVQMNVVPGLPTRFAFTPTITTADMRYKLNKPTFDYILLCNKICGSAHYRMKLKVVIDTQAEYDKWLSEQAPLVAKKAAAEPTPAAPVSMNKAGNKALAAN